MYSSKSPVYTGRLLAPFLTVALDELFIKFILIYLLVINYSVHFNERNIISNSPPSFLIIICYNELLQQHKFPHQIAFRVYNYQNTS